MQRTILRFRHQDDFKKSRSKNSTKPEIEIKLPPGEAKAGKDVIGTKRIGFKDDGKGKMGQESPQFEYQPQHDPSKLPLSWPKWPKNGSKGQQALLGKGAHGEGMRPPQQPLGMMGMERPPGRRGRKRGKNTFVLYNSARPSVLQEM